MNIDLEKWLEKLKMDKLKIDENIAHIEALLKTLPNQLESINCNYDKSLFISPNTEKELYTNLHANIDKKIHKGHEIYKACENMIQEFTSSDIKHVLEQSPNEDVRKITLAYISHLLGKFEKDKKIKFSRTAIGKGNPNYYTFNRGNNIEQIETEQKESPRICA